MSILKKVNVEKSAGKKYMVNVEMYGTVGDMTTLLKTRSITSSSFENQQTERLDTSWCGVKSYDEACEFLHNGYQPSVEKLKERMKAKYVGEGKRITFHNDVVGYAPIVPLAMQGVPQSMLNHKMKPIKAKVIDVFYDITVNCGTTSEQILNNGSNLLGAIVDLEQEGYKVNIYAVQSYSDGIDCDMLIIKIKDSKQPMDLKRMSFPLTHTAFFRVIGFDWYSKVPGGRYRYDYGNNLNQSFGREKSTAIIREVSGNDRAVVLYGKEMLSQGADHIKEVIKNESGNKRN